MAKIEVTLVKSLIGSTPAQKKVVEALGLRKINSKNVFEDSKSIRGSIAKVSHLLSVKEVK